MPRAGEGGRVSTSTWAPRRGQGGWWRCWWRLSCQPEDMGSHGGLLPLLSFLSPFITSH